MCHAPCDEFDDALDLTMRHAPCGEFDDVLDLMVRRAPWGFETIPKFRSRVDTFGPKSRSIFITRHGVLRSVAGVDPYVK